MLPGCPGRPQGQRGRARSHGLAGLPGRLGGCLRERDGGHRGLSAVAVMHGCDAVAAIQDCRQVQPAASGRRRSAAPGAIIGGARLVFWAFRRPGELAGWQRGAGVSLGRESILSFVLCVYALGTPEGVGGGRLLFTAKRRPGGSPPFFDREIRGFFYLLTTDNRGKSSNDARLEISKLGVRS